MKTGTIQILGSTKLDAVYTNTAPVLLRVSRELPLIINDFIDIGYFTVSGGTHSFRITTYFIAGNISISKQYFVTSASALFPNWAQLVPVADSGVFGADLALDIRQPAGGLCYLRLRRTAGDSTRTGTVELKIEYIARTIATFTETTTTGSATLPVDQSSGLYHNSQLKRLAANTTTPGTNLQVTGGFAVTSSAAAVADPGSGNASISGWLSTNGFCSSYRIITADYTIILTDYTIEANCTSSNITMTLPTAIGNTGRTFLVKKIDASANTLTIDAFGTQTLDGTLTKVIAAQYQKLTLISTGANWSLY